MGSRIKHIKYRSLQSVVQRTSAAAAAAAAVISQITVVLNDVTIGRQARRHGRK